MTTTEDDAIAEFIATAAADSIEDWQVRRKAAMKRIEEILEADAERRRFMFWPFAEKSATGVWLAGPGRVRWDCELAAEALAEATGTTVRWLFNDRLYEAAP